MVYDWQLSLILEYWPAFLGGFILTMKLTIVTIVFGTLLGYFLGILLSLAAFTSSFRFSSRSWPSFSAA